MSTLIDELMNDVIERYQSLYNRMRPSAGAKSKRRLRSRRVTKAHKYNIPKGQPAPAPGAYVLMEEYNITVKCMVYHTPDGIINAYQEIIYTVSQ